MLQLTKMKNVHIIVVMEYLLHFPLSFNLYRTCSTTDNKVSTNQSKSNPPSRAWSIAEWLDLSDMPCVCMKTMLHNTEEDESNLLLSVLSIQQCSIIATASTQILIAEWLNRYRIQHKKELKLL